MEIEAEVNEIKTEKRKKRTGLTKKLNLVL